MLKRKNIEGYKVIRVSIMRQESVINYRWYVINYITFFFKRITG
jgi:hypothetical protein